MDSVFRDDNGAGSGWVAPIPTPLRLFKIIPIPNPFEKLNGRDVYDKFPYSPRSIQFNFFIFLIFLKVTF